MKRRLEFTVFEKKAEELIRKYKVPGVAIALSQNREPIYEKVYGFRNVEHQLPVTMDTVFGIASVTKSFTCIAILQLQEEGKLSIHDPVIRYLPEFSLPECAASKMTLHHFMTHSTGLPPLPSILLANKKTIDSDPTAHEFSSKLSKKDSIDTYEHLIEFISKQDTKLLGSPGEEFSYSNDCFSLLGAIIERVSGKHFENYIEEKIFKPVGMDKSCFLVRDLESYDNVTSLYASRKTEKGEEIFESPVWWDAPAMRGAGYLKSNVTEMIKYGEIFWNNGKVGENQILSPESVQLMVKPHIEVFPGKYYGYGLFVTPNHYGETLIEHDGNHKGISSHFCVIPERRLTGVILTNLAGVPSPTILNGAINVIKNLEFEYSPLKNSTKWNPNELKDYVGIYTSIGGERLKVTLNDENLQFGNIPVDCIGEDTFLALIRDQSKVVRFIRNDDRQIVRLQFHYRQFFKKIND
ncbi:serine hydrolase [Bacillus salitolerans]|uniref:Serine hydrolase n=1 Tax=Bacillus salitolerans TaxID=1437434 RepID=A0ABW4LL37_9BACI